MPVREVSCAGDEVPDDVFEIRADVVKAMSVALTDFELFLRGRTTDKDVASHDGVVQPVDVTRYSVVPARKSSIYLIWIHPKVGAEYSGVFGGDVLYKIDALSYRIEERQLGK